MKTEFDQKNIVKFIVLVCTGVLLMTVAWNYGPWIIENAKQPEKIRDYLLSFGNFGFLIYVLIQAVHVLVVVIPGDLFNICGGYIYGTPIGFVLSIVGIMLGSITAFYLSRFLGYDFIAKFVEKDKIDKISKTINSTQGMIGTFIICLIPFIPKDLMMYIAGLTPIKPSRLFIIYGISRIPGTIIWVSVGANMYSKDTFGIAITLVGLIVFASLTYILRKIYKCKSEEFFWSII